MTNAELIKALLNCSDGMCSLCPYDELSAKECEVKLMRDAADALEAADEKIADYTAAVEALDDSNDAYIIDREKDDEILKIHKGDKA